MDAGSILTSVPSLLVDDDADEDVSSRPSQKKRKRSCTKVPSIFGKTTSGPRSTAAEEYKQLVDDLDLSDDPELDGEQEDECVVSAKPEAVSVYPGPSTIELPNVYGPQSERYGCNYNLEAVFAVSITIEEENIEVLIIRDRIGTENYWFPAKTMVQMCGFKHVSTAMKKRYSGAMVLPYKALQQSYGFTYPINHNAQYMNEEALTSLFYGRLRINAYKSENIRSLINQFYRTRKYVVGETIKQLADEYVRRSLPLGGGASAPS
jgi:hypothetical protein